MQFHITNLEAAQLKEALKESWAVQKTTFTVYGISFRFLYTWHIKRIWNPCYAFMELILNWAVFWSTIAALIDPDDKDNLVFGAVVMCINSCLMHYWYGFLRYSSLVRGCFGEDGMQEYFYDLDQDFKMVKEIFSALYNGDDIKRSQAPAILLTLPFTLFLHVASALFLCIMVCLDIWSNEKKERRNDDFDAWAAYGVLLAFLAFPLMFIYGSPGFKVLATFGMLTTEQLYNSLLFRKPFKKFLVSLVFGLIDLDYFDLDVDMDFEWDEAKEANGENGDDNEIVIEGKGSTLPPHIKPTMSVVEKSDDQSDVQDITPLASSSEITKKPDDHSEAEEIPPALISVRLSEIPNDLAGAIDLTSSSVCVLGPQEPNGWYKKRGHGTAL